MNGIEKQIADTLKKGVTADINKFFQNKTRENLDRALLTLNEVSNMLVKCSPKSASLSEDYRPPLSTLNTAMNPVKQKLLLLPDTVIANHVRRAGPFPGQEANYLYIATDINIEIIRSLVRDFFPRAKVRRVGMTISCIVLLSDGVEVKEFGRKTGNAPGRPLGKLGASKLDGKETEILELIRKNVSKTSIAKIYGVCRGTLIHFIDTRLLRG